MNRTALRGAGLAALSLLALAPTRPAPAPERSDEHPAPAPTAPPIAAYDATPTPGGAVAAAPADTWVPGVFMVRPAPGQDLAALGARVLRAPGRSGYGLVAPPAGESDAAFEARLRRAGLADVAPTGRVRGAGKKSTATTLSATTATSDASAPATTRAMTAEATTTTAAIAAESTATTATTTTWSSVGTVDDGSSRKLDRVSNVIPLQWHHHGIGTTDLWFNGSGKATWLPANVTQPWVVAVLDSGVTFVGGLSTVARVAAWDFVNGDPVPQDDHQHGTHIASLIAAASNGLGVSRGTTIMPLKVLDAANSGYELDLVEAIHHAVDNGADVINLSLSFGHGYQPSWPLQEAIERAHQAGVVLVGAAGNDGSDEVTWPAASPRVIAVAAGTIAPGATASPSTMMLPSYATSGPRVDVVAPGGDLNADRDGNGYSDGMVAETIDPLAPTTPGVWMYAGSSQAAAVVSAGVVRLLDGGVAPTRVLAALQESGTPLANTDSRRTGGGAINPTAALGTAQVVPMGERHVGLTAWLAPDPAGVVPRVVASLYNSAGAPVAGETLIGRFDGDVSGLFSCVTDAAGTCLVTLADAAGPADLALRVTVEAVRKGRQQVAPGAVFIGSAETQALLESMQATYPGASLAFYYDGGTDPVLGATAPCYTFPSFGTGLASTPMITLLSPSKLFYYGASTLEGAVPLDGTGLASTPMITTRFITFSMSGSTFAALDGTGLASTPMVLSPLRFTSLSTTSFSGTGLASTPMLTFTSLTTLRYFGSGADSGAVSLLTGSTNGASQLGAAVALNP